MYVIRLALLLASALVLVPVYAEPAAAPSEEVQLKELSDRSGGKLFATRKTTKPDAPLVALYGDLFDAQPQGGLATGKAFIEKYGSLLGFPAGPMPAEYAVSTTTKKEKGETITVVPGRGGVRYLAGAITFALGTDGKLVGVAGRYRSLATATMGGIDAARAVQTALSELSKKYPGSWLSEDGSITEALADTQEGGIRHEYSVRISIGDKRLPKHVVLGPGGEVLLEEDGGEPFTEGAGNVFADYPANTLQQGSLPELHLADFNFPIFGRHFMSDSSYPNLRAHLDGGKADYPPYLVPPVSSYNGLPDPRFLEVNAYHHLMTARNKAVEWGAKEVDEIIIPFDIWANVSNNAFYSSSSHRVKYARNNAMTSGIHPALDASVTYHEYGHHVQWSLCNTAKEGGTTNQNNEAKGLGEGFADVFATSITGKSNVFEVWCKTIPAVQRDAAGANATDFAYCKWVPCVYNAPAGSISCHDTGRVFSGLCWELRKKVFHDDPNWLMMRLVWALRDTPGPQTFQAICWRMLLDQALYGVDDAMFPEMVKLMNERGVLTIVCPPPAP